MSGDPLDLDAIEARANRAVEHIGTSSFAYPSASVDVPALVAEVRWLRADRDALLAACADLRTFINGQPS
jgi:hypothetical protein